MLDHSIALILTVQQGTIAEIPASHEVYNGMATILVGGLTK